MTTGKLFLALLLLLWGGGGDTDGADILPKTFELGGGAAGLEITICPEVPATDGETACPVAIAGRVSAFGGDSIAPAITGSEPGALNISCELSKIQPDDPQQSPLTLDDGRSPKDKRIVRISIYVPLNELIDGDLSDVEIGSAEGWNPLLGWGHVPIYGPSGG